MRPPFSHERLSITEDGKVLLGLRKPWPTPAGVSAVCFEPVQFLRRLTPLIPPPFAHLIRYHGLFAPNAKGRDLLPAAPVSWTGIRPEACVRAGGAPAKGTTDDGTTAAPLAPGPPRSISPKQPSDHGLPCALQPEPHGARPDETGDPLHAAPTPTPDPTPGGTKRPRRRRVPWAELLRRVFAVDVLLCPRCGGQMAVIAYITEAAVLAKILSHLGLPSAPPPILPARLPEQTELFEDDTPWGRSDRGRQGRGRGPPSERDTGTLFDSDAPEDDGDWAA